MYSPFNPVHVDKVQNVWIFNVLKYFKDIDILQPLLNKILLLKSMDFEDAIGKALCGQFVV